LSQSTTGFVLPLAMHLSVQPTSQIRDAVSVGGVTAPRHRPSTPVSMRRTLDQRSLADLVRNHGGILGAIEYGVSADDIEDPELASAWRRVVEQYAALRPNLAVINRGLTQARRAA
jgi:hypothetical protein